MSRNSVTKANHSTELLPLLERTLTAPTERPILSLQSSPQSSVLPIETTLVPFRLLPAPAQFQLMVVGI